MAELGEKCAIFGLCGKRLEAARLTFFGLFALQYRGQKSSGIVSSDGTELRLHRKMGLVAQVFAEKDMQRLSGHLAVGHNRYLTSKGSALKHAQPTMIEDVGLALSHNGNLPLTTALERFPAAKGIARKSLSDSGMIAEAVAVHMRNGKNLEEAIREVYLLMTGVFSILIMDRENIIAIRDAHGIRPLSIGTLNGWFIFSSETCALNPIGAEYLRDVAPGEMAIVSAKSLRSVQLAEGHQKLDIFELVYFARPDSILLGKSVYGVRKRCGIEFAKEYPLPADIVIPVPETPIPVAIGYAGETDIPLEMALIKNRYIHRTFIQPEQHVREQGVKLKLTPIPEAIQGKRVTVIDDSIVRGTTSKQLVQMLFEAGAKVNFLLSSPPVRFSDFYGIDTPTQSHLIATSKTPEEIQTFLGAIQLNYLSFEWLIHATGIPEELFCTSCFTVNYPIDLKERVAEVQSLLTLRLF